MNPSRITSLFRSPWLSGIALSIGMAVGACADEDDVCTVGTEACSCTETDACVEGLTCVSSVCVAPEAADEGDEGDDNASGPAAGDDAMSSGNGEACEKLIDSLSCGADLGQALNCAQYDALPCDVSAYFDCAADVLKCPFETTDTAAFAQCAALARC